MGAPTKNSSHCGGVFLYHTIIFNGIVKNFALEANNLYLSGYFASEANLNYTGYLTLTQQWESYAKHKHNDCPEHVHQQVAGCHDDDQTNHWVVPLESPCCPLAVRTVHKDAKCCRNCSKSTNHLYRVKNSEKERTFPYLWALPPTTWMSSSNSIFLLLSQIF